MADGDLVTIDQALAWLNQNVDQNGVIAGLISSISGKIQKFVGYQFAEASYTRTFNGNNSHMLLLPDRPVISVQSVTIDTFTPPQSTSPVMPGFTWDDRFVYLRGGFGLEYRGSWAHDRFHHGIQNVQIAYTAGYATIPADVQQACLDWMSVAWEIASGEVSPAARMMRAGDTQIDFRSMQTELGKQTVLMPPIIAAALMPYRRTATA